MSVASPERLDRVLGLTHEERGKYDRRYLVYLIAIAVADPADAPGPALGLLINAQNNRAGGGRRGRGVGAVGRDVDHARGGCGARRGGSRCRPTTSRTLSMNRASLESFQVSWRCGRSPNARQIQATIVCQSPAPGRHRPRRPARRVLGR